MGSRVLKVEGKLVKVTIDRRGGRVCAVAQGGKELLDGILGGFCNDEND